MANAVHPPIYISGFERPPLRDALRHARDFLATVDQPTRSEVWGVYRAARLGLPIFLRCTFVSQWPGYFLAQSAKNP